MKITYSVLYKNGCEDTIRQLITDDNFDRIQKVNETIQTALKENLDGHVTIGDEGTDITSIKLSEVVRVNYMFKEEDL